MKVFFKLMYKKIYRDPHYVQDDKNNKEKKWFEVCQHIKEFHKPIDND